MPSEFGAKRWPSSKFLDKLILVTMQCNIFYHLSSIVYIASTHVQLAGCDNVKHIENECTKVPIL